MKINKQMVKKNRNKIKQQPNLSFFFFATFILSFLVDLIDIKKSLYLSFFIPLFFAVVVISSWYYVYVCLFFISWSSLLLEV